MHSLLPTRRCPALRRSWTCLVALPLLLGIASCGGDDDEEEPEICYETSLQNCGSGPWDPFGIALALAWYSGQCTEEVACTTEPIQSDPTNGIITNEFIASNWTTNSAGETESNDDFNEANPFVIPQQSGLVYRGTLNDSTDTTDTLALVFDTSGYVTYLCATTDDCLQPWLTGSTVHLELYDQNEVLLYTTQGSTDPNGHHILFEASAGLLYYLKVRANDTGGADFDYKLVVTD